jgi:hypothetical protein
MSSKDLEKGLRRTHSCEAIRTEAINTKEIRTEPKRKLRQRPVSRMFRSRSVESLITPAFTSLPRSEQREKIMRYLRHESPKTPGFEGKASEELGENAHARFLAVADDYQSRRSFKFNRFERLCILDILYAQSRLIHLDEMLQYAPIETGNDLVETPEMLHQGIQTYGCSLLIKCGLS